MTARLWPLNHRTFRESYGTSRQQQMPYPRLQGNWVLTAKRALDAQGLRPRRMNQPFFLILRVPTLTPNGTRLSNERAGYQARKSNTSATSKSPTQMSQFPGLQDMIRTRKPSAPGPLARLRGPTPRPAATASPATRPARGPSCCRKSSTQKSELPR